MRSAILRFLIAGKDYTKFVHDFSYERDMEKDNYANIKFRNSSDIQSVLDLVDSKSLNRGSLVEFQYGFLGQPLSALHRVYIREIMVDYSSTVTIEIKCLDKGSVVKRNYSGSLLKGKTIDIVRNIANKYNLELDYDKRHKYKNYNQAAQAFSSDYDLLRRLAAIEGNFDFYIDSNVLHFKPSGKGRGIVRRFNYGVDIHDIKVALRSIRKKKDNKTSNNSSVTQGKTITQVVSDGQKQLESLNRSKQEAKILVEKANLETIIATKPEQLFIKNSDPIRETARQRIMQERSMQENAKRSAEKYKKQRAELELKAGGLIQSYVDSKGGSYTYDNLTAAFKQNEAFLKDNYGSTDPNDFVFGGSDGEEGIDGETGKIIRLSLRPKNNQVGSDPLSNGNNASPENEPEKKRFECDLTMELDGTYRLGDKIDIQGLAKRHSGVWIVVKIMDKIPASGRAMTTLTLARKARLEDGNEESLAKSDGGSGSNATTNSDNGGMFIFNGDGSASGVKRGEQEYSKEEASKVNVGDEAKPDLTKRGFKFNN